MVKRRQRGYSLLEVVVTMSVFTALLAIFFVLTAEMRKWEKRLPVNYLRHPQVSAVMGRLRRDVLDAHIPSGPYLSSFKTRTATYENSPKTLIIATLVKGGGLQTVVWDFTQAGSVSRRAFTATMAETMWVAHGVPADFSSKLNIDAVEFVDRPYGVRVVAKDSNGRTSIDQILQPRAYND